jgi:hypothetical protein
VQAGWIAMACSGQVYGLNGSALLLTKEHEQQFFSHDLIRIIPDTGKIRAGFLLTALTHPTLGRPLVIRAAYGTSIPHLDPADVSAVPVVRFDAAIEGAIADCAESSAAARAEADALERELSEDAGRLIDRFIASGSLTGMGSVRSHASSPLRPTPSLVEHARVRLRAAMAKHQLRAGATGTIVHIYGDGAGYEVEFDASSASPKVVTLEHDAIEPLTD